MSLFGPGSLSRPPIPPRGAALRPGITIPVTLAALLTVAGCGDDLCPDDLAKRSPGLCGCGIPDDDGDSDTIPDCLDICDGFDDGADADGDLVPDGCDADLYPCDDVYDCDDGLDCTEDRCDDGLCRTSPAGLCDWPAEGPLEAVNLTGLEGEEPNGFQSNLSGAAWNPVSRTLWVASNGGPARIWTIDLSDPEQPFIPEEVGIPAQWGYLNDFRDLEALTFVDFEERSTLYTLAENDNSITRWDMSTHAIAAAEQVWDLWELLPPPSGYWGSEALTFVPDAYLVAQGFTDSAGELAQSAGGLGGLMLVGHQSGGRVFALDLDVVSGDAALVGEYSTTQDEVAGLEFDRSTGLLYIWHGGAPLSLEAARLSSSPDGDGRRLDAVRVHVGPGVPAGGSSNIEGFAITGSGDCVAGSRSAFLTTDDGGAWSLLRYAEFPCW